MEDIPVWGLENKYDKVFCIGVKHHLDDEQAGMMMQFARAILKEDGVFLSLEPVWSPPQGWLERWFMRNDRGKYIRTEEQYRKLVSPFFSDIRIDILKGTMNIPFTIAITTARH